MSGGIMTENDLNCPLGLIDNCILGPHPWNSDEMACVNLRYCRNITGAVILPYECTRIDGVPAMVVHEIYDYMYLDDTHEWLRQRHFDGIRYGWIAAEPVDDYWDPNDHIW